MSEKSNHILKTLRREGDFFVVHIPDNAITGQTFEKLGRHVTLLSPFTTLGCIAVSGFIETIPDVEALEAHVGERRFGDVDYFGDSNDTAVRPIVGEAALSLMAIHVLLLARFRPYVHDLTYAGQHYRPHMTIKSDNDDPGEGASIKVDSACLIRKMEEGGYMIYQADKFKSAKQE